MTDARHTWLFAFRWMTGFQFAWIALIALNALQVLQLPWLLVMSPLWIPFVLLLLLELRIALVDTWARRNRHPGTGGARCIDCNHPINAADDDARLCVDCGGFNRRSL